MMELDLSVTTAFLNYLIETTVGFRLMVSATKQKLRLEIGA